MLLVLLFAYDIFFVFLTPLLTKVSNNAIGFIDVILYKDSAKL